jgi:hypothetical protein
VDALGASRAEPAPAGASGAPAGRAGFLLLDSVGRWGDPAQRFARIASALAESGARTVLCLVGDGVSHAVGSSGELARLAGFGGRIWVDRVALGRRGLTGREPAVDIEEVGMDDICDAVLAPGTRVVWH